MSQYTTVSLSQGNNVITFSYYSTNKTFKADTNAIFLNVDMFKYCQDILICRVNLPLNQTQVLGPEMLKSSNQLNSILFSDLNADARSCLPAIFLWVLLHSLNWVSVSLLTTAILSPLPPLALALRPDLMLAPSCQCPGNAFRGPLCEPWSSAVPLLRDISHTVLVPWHTEPFSF